VRVNVQALDDKAKGEPLAREASQLAAKAAELADRTGSIVERALSR
jgi:formiminotetrahydrofolate cyclodeaminase